MFSSIFFSCSNPFSLHHIPSLFNHLIMGTVSHPPLFLLNFNSLLIRVLKIVPSSTPITGPTVFNYPRNIPPKNHCPNPTPFSLCLAGYLHYSTHFISCLPKEPCFTTFLNFLLISLLTILFNIFLVTIPYITSCHI